jgi:PAS domain S-box-containing protein
VDTAFGQFVRLLPDAFVVLGEDWVVLAANDAASTLLRRPAAALIGRSLLEAVDDGDGRVTRYLGLCVRSRQPVPGALKPRDDGAPSLRCDGALLRPRSGDTPARILLRCRPRPEASGRFVALNEKIAALNHEILQRRRSEAALLEHRERLRVTLQSIGDAVITTDREARVTFLNPVAERLTGWTCADALGRPLVEVFEIVNEDTRATVENPIARVLQTGHVVGLANHTVLIARDGAERPIEDSAAPILDDAGQILGVVLVFHDVSERKQGERERERLLAAERAARADAERMNHLKDEFLATVSHELRTPLNAILGWATILRMGGASADVAQGIETIERNARVQARIIEDLLDMSRIISGKLRLEMRPMDLVQVIGNAVESVRPAAQAREIRLLPVLDTALEPVYGDAGRIQQVVWNLLTNAIKFTPRGGLVQVFLERLGPRVEITVADSGAGIPPHFLPHLFERFRQADGSTTRQHGGLGLGLSIVKHLVELHGGGVRAESAGEGRGAQFIVSLPVYAAREADATSAPPGHSVELVPLGTDIDLAGVRVLVVDDEPDALTLVRRLLEDRNARVLVAAGCDEAVELFVRERPDCIVSDIGMPGKDGYTFIRAVRRAEASLGTFTPALALTAFARAEDRARALLAGYQGHVAKPVEPAEFLAVVAAVTGRTIPAA